MNTDKIKEVLKNLEEQFKVANDQALIYNGAVQGAKAIIEVMEIEEISLEELTEEIELPVVELSTKTKRG